jgi:phage terminase large subunit
LSTLSIPTAEVFVPLLEKARDKGAYGGRGSGKSHFFAGMLVEDCLAEPGEVGGEGMRAVCIREVQKDLAQSSKLLIESKLADFGLGEKDGFKIFREVIETPGDGMILFKGMQDYTAESIKSLEGFKRSWWEEAQSATSHSIKLLRPTLRTPGSQMWWSWNSRRKHDAVDVMLRGPEKPTGAIVVNANWRDNPWFTDELEQERTDCKRMTPDDYDHVWEGGYVSIASGAYFASQLTAAKAEGRIGQVAADPLMTIRLFVDIGGTGAKADAFTMWAVQFIGTSVRVLDYYEAVGQDLATHLNWLRSKNYGPDRAQIWLPHDGATHDKVHNVSYESAFGAAGYSVTVVPNQGKGAAGARIEAVRRLFPSIWFNEATTEAGRDALGWYHEKKDEVRQVGLGPDHDWSSHGCFLGSTQILTRYGTCRIDSLDETGEVLTPCGWKQYIYPRITKRHAQLVEVAFTDGHLVKCTPDHLFLTEGGWKSAESLTQNTVIQSTLMNSRSILTGGFIGFGQANRIFQRAASDCTETHGCRHLAPFQKVAIFTIATEMFSTIKSTILNVCLHLSIYRNPELSGLSQGMDGFLSLPATRLRNGIVHQKVGFGTRETRSVLKAGLNGGEKKSRASIVAFYIKHWFARAAMQANIAGVLAKLLLIGFAARLTNTQLRIAHVKRLKEQHDVWDITVPEGHCFSLSNGAVVHNSDSFGLMAVVYEAPVAARKIIYKNKGIY